MESQYIVAIIGGSIFLSLVLVYIILKAIRERKLRKERVRLFEAYNDEALAKMEYDFAIYDEEQSEPLDGQPEREELTSVEEEAEMPQEEVFAKIDSESMEEITGNYRPK